MNPPVIGGMALGASISVVDSTALSALDPNGLTIGTAVNDLGTPATWILTISTAALSSTVKAVKGITGWRWIKYSAPAGVVATVVGGLGAAVDSTDPANPIVSTKAPTWLQTARDRARALGGLAAFDSEDFNDFVETGTWDKTTSSTATATLSTTLAGGVVSLTSDSSDSVIVHPAGKPSLIANIGTSAFFVQWRAKFTGPSGANCLQYVGIQSTGLANTVRIGSIGSFAGGSNSFFAISAYNGTTDTIQATATALDTSNHDFGIFSDGTTITYYIDGVSVGTTLASNAGSTNAMWVARSFTNDTTSRNVLADKVYMAFKGQ